MGFLETYILRRLMIPFFNSKWYCLEALFLARHATFILLSSNFRWPQEMFPMNCHVSEDTFHFSCTVVSWPHTYFCCRLGCPDRCALPGYVKTWLVCADSRMDVKLGVLSAGIHWWMSKIPLCPSQRVRECLRHHEQLKNSCTLSRVSCVVEETCPGF